MQQEMIREIEGTSPKYLVSVVIFYSWLWRPGSDRSIFTWANEYTAQNYTVAGFVNIVTPDKTDYYLITYHQQCTAGKIHFDLPEEILEK